jgi:hypothetical protein
MENNGGQLTDIIEKDYSHRSHRKALGIPEKLNNHPVLYVSSHRGFLDARYSSHIELFKRVWKGEETPDEDREYAYLDLTTASQKQIISYLRHVIIRDDPSQKGKRLVSDTSENDPLPGFIANIQYLPPLDNKGKAREPSQTFAINPDNNARLILEHLKDFLEEKGFLKDDSTSKRLSF